MYKAWDPVDDDERPFNGAGYVTINFLIMSGRLVAINEVNPAPPWLLGKKIERTLSWAGSWWDIYVRHMQKAGSVDAYCCDL